MQTLTRANVKSDLPVRLLSGILIFTTKLLRRQHSALLQSWAARDGARNGEGLVALSTQHRSNRLQDSGWALPAVRPHPPGTQRRGYEAYCRGRRQLCLHWGPEADSIGCRGGERATESRSYGGSCGKSKHWGIATTARSHISLPYIVTQVSFSLWTAVLTAIVMRRGCYPQTRSDAQVYLQKSAVDQFQRVHTAEDSSGCCSPLHASSPTGSRWEFYWL